MFLGILADYIYPDIATFFAFELPKSGKPVPSNATIRKQGPDFNPARFDILDAIVCIPINAYMQVNVFANLARVSDKQTTNETDQPGVWRLAVALLTSCHAAQILRLHFSSSSWVLCTWVTHLLLALEWVQWIIWTD